MVLSRIALRGRRRSPPPLANPRAEALRSSMRIGPGRSHPLKTRRTLALPISSLARRLRVRRAPTPEPEATLREQPLKVAGSGGPIAEIQGRSSGWHTVLNDERRRSFVSYRKRAFTDATLRQWFNNLHDKIAWNQPRVGERLLPRSAAWLTEGSCKCQYRYGGTSWPALKMEQWFLEITDAVCQACGITERPNSCNANLYKDGTESVGWHSDDEPLFDACSHDTLILSLSLGESREFVVRPNDDPDENTSLRLADGDICTMEGLLQKHYKHRVPPQRGARRARINLTWRWVVAHDKGCPLHRERLPAPSRPDKVAPGVFADPARDKTDFAAEPQVRRGLKRSSAAIGTASAETKEVSEEEKAKRLKRAQRFGAVGTLVKSVVKLAPGPDTPVGSAPVSPLASSNGEKLTNEEQRRSRALRFGLQDSSTSEGVLGNRRTGGDDEPQRRTVQLISSALRKATDSAAQSAVAKLAVGATPRSSLGSTESSTNSSGSHATLKMEAAGLSEDELRKKRRAERFGSSATGVAPVGAAPAANASSTDPAPAAREQAIRQKSTEHSASPAPVAASTGVPAKSEAELRQSRAERFASAHPAPGATSQQDPKQRPAERLASLGTTEDVKKRRAERFASPAPAEAQDAKQKRAERFASPADAKKGLDTASQAVKKVGPESSSKRDMSSMTELEKRAERAKRFG